PLQQPQRPAAVAGLATHQQQHQRLTSSLLVVPGAYAARLHMLGHRIDALSVVWLQRYARTPGSVTASPSWASTSTARPTPRRPVSRSKRITTPRPGQGPSMQVAGATAAAMRRWCASSDPLQGLLAALGHP